MRYPLLITLLFSFFFAFSYSGAENDDFETTIKSMPDNEKKVDMLNDEVDRILAPEPNVSNCKRARPLAHDAAKLAEKLNYKPGMARSYEQLTLIYKTLDYQIQYVKYKAKAALIDRGEVVKEQEQKIEKINSDLDKQNKDLNKQKQILEQQRLEAERAKRELEMLAKDNTTNKDLIEKKQRELREKEAALSQTSGELDLMKDEAEKLANKNKILLQDAKIKTLEVERQKIQKYFLISILAIILILAGFLFNLYRTKQRTAKELAEKNEIILAEKKRSDELLLNILPLETANELKLNGKAVARDYEMVTVLFSDFKDFTVISEKLSPKDLVDEIDMCYSAFDNIIEKHNIEKIKTIGDAYLCASGIAHDIDKSIKHNPSNVIDAAFEIVAFMDEMMLQRQKEGRPFFKIRIGIHSGPLVAGVVGKKKFAYDIWGDTVNTAARMEQNSEPGKINVSSVTHSMASNQYKFTYRGKIEAKNKGSIDMYFVDEKITQS